MPSARQRLAEQMALASPTRSPAARHPTRTAHHSRNPYAGLVTAIAREREGGSLVACFIRGAVNYLINRKFKVTGVQATRQPASCYQQHQDAASSTAQEAAAHSGRTHHVRWNYSAGHATINKIGDGESSGERRPNRRCVLEGELQNQMKQEEHVEVRQFAISHSRTRF